MRKILIISGLFFGVFVFAQTISYPVAELDNCQSRESCRQYCNVLSNAEACLNFAESHQLFTSAELQEARKVVNALKQGEKTPGDCQNKSECNAYCAQRKHIRECFNFARKVGLIPAGELEQARKSLSFIENGESPGGCVTKEQCDAYCGKEEHKQECMTFAIKAGLITQEEAERYEKTGGKGPGGCQSKEECDVYCNKSENQQACFEFGRKHGLVSQEELDMIKNETQKMQDTLYSASPEVISCLNERLGSDVVEKLKSGNFLPSPKIGDVTKACFEKYKEGEEEGVQKMQNALQSAPPEVINCLNEKLGPDVVENLRSGGAPSGPEAGETVRSCFEEYYAKQQLPQEGGYAPGTGPGEGPPPEGEMPPEGMPSEGQFPEGQPPEGMPLEGEMMPEGGMMPPEGQMGAPEVEGE